MPMAKGRAPTMQTWTQQCSPVVNSWVKLDRKNDAERQSREEGEEREGSGKKKSSSNTGHFNSAGLPNSFQLDSSSSPHTAATGPLLPACLRLLIRCWAVTIPTHSSHDQLIKHTLKMSSGLLAATSSISTPPWGLPTITGPLNDRSIRMAK